MVPTAFDESNFVLDKPDNMSRDQCDPLSVAIGQSGNAPVVISCWKCTSEDLAEINRTGRVWLVVLGQGMPPVMLSGVKPDFHESPGTPDGQSQTETD